MKWEGKVRRGRSTNIDCRGSCGWRERLRIGATVHCRLSQGDRKLQGAVGALKKVNER